MPRYEVFEIGKRDSPREVIEGDDANLMINPVVIFKKNADGVLEAVQQVMLQPGWAIKVRS
jgi:hypothetical protein